MKGNKLLTPEFQRQLQIGEKTSKPRAPENNPTDCTRQALYTFYKQKTQEFD